MRNIEDLTAEELDALPNWQSGLPTHPVIRAEALQAWREGGIVGFEKWRSEHTRKAK